MSERCGDPPFAASYRDHVAQWRIELKTEDVVALSRGEEILAVAIDEEQDLSEDSIEVTIALLDY